jgi:hypothetical protein
MNIRISVCMGIFAWSLAWAALDTQGQVSLQASFSTTIQVQTTNQTDNGTTSVSPAPTTMRFGTKEMLAQLALDENAAGHYDSTKFPAGAKLVYIDDPDSPRYEVLDRSNNLLLDVSDMFYHTFAGNGVAVTVGKTTDATGAGTTTQQGLDTWTYEDGEYGPISMSMTGLGTLKRTVSAPNKSGVQTISESFSLKNASGQGHITLNEINAVMTGSEQASGKATQSSP